MAEPHTFDSLFDLLVDRTNHRPAGSSTVAALDGGIHGVAKKVLEEAGEVWLAAEHGSDEELATEIAQVIYWLQVVMVERDLKPSDIYRHL